MKHGKTLHRRIVFPMRRETILKYTQYSRDFLPCLTAALLPQGHFAAAGVSGAGVSGAGASGGQPSTGRPLANWKNISRRLGIPPMSKQSLTPFLALSRENVLCNLFLVTFGKL